MFTGHFSSFSRFTNHILCSFFFVFFILHFINHHKFPAKLVTCLSIFNLFLLFILLFWFLCPHEFVKYVNHSFRCSDLGGTPAFNFSAGCNLQNVTSEFLDEVETFKSKNILLTHVNRLYFIISK